MGKFKGRNPTACTHCHSQKVKCSGDAPCERCKARGRECVYPIKDQIHQVPESYLRSLTDELRVLRQRPASGALTPLALGPACQSSEARQVLSIETDEKLNSNEDGHLLEDCSAESFVQKLRELSISSPTDGPGEARDTSSGCPGLHYTYSKLNFDSFQADVTFRLPPLPYTMRLLAVFEEGFSDYHWYLRQDFHQCILLTYSNPSSQIHDRNWLCRLSVILALAETYNASKLALPSRDGKYGAQDSTPAACSSDLKNASDGRISGLRSGTVCSVPGSELFEQSLLLLKVSPEEPTVEDVVALNLLAFYSYNLNRRKTAHLYAGQGIRLAQLLRLDEPDLSSHSRADSEHRKRVWWTSYCMDRMTTTELGLRSVYDAIPTSIQAPSSDAVSQEDQDQFFHPEILAAQTQLCHIKGKIVETVTHRLRASDLLHRRTVEVLQPCLEMLGEWRRRLPEDMSYTFEHGIPAEMTALPFDRTLTSLYLRYYQCSILLLRPFLLQELSLITQRPVSGAQHGGPTKLPTRDVEPLISECFHAANYNARILVDLWRTGKIAIFGYWDSLHLFSALAILSLSRAVLFSSGTQNTHINDDRGPPGPAGLSWEARTAPAQSRDVRDDPELFKEACALLDEMAGAGNLAARDHRRMLADVEEMVTCILSSAQRQPGPVGPAEHLTLNDPALHPWGDLGSAGGTDGAGSFGGLDSILDEQLWYEMDWEDILGV